MLLARLTISQFKSNTHILIFFRSVKKFIKSYFALQDNVLDKKLMAYIDQKNFTRKKYANEIIKKIHKFFSLHFADGDEQKGIKLLEPQSHEIRKKDAVLLAFFSGSLAVTLIVTFFVCLLDPSKYESWETNWNKIFASFPTFRFFLMIILTLFFTGIDVKILRAFKVNYLFIFELDPHYKITHI